MVVGARYKFENALDINTHRLFEKKHLTSIYNPI